MKRLSESLLSSRLFRIKTQGTASTIPINVIFLYFLSSVGVPGNLPIFGESGGISRLYQLAEWFGPCDLIAERDFISRRAFICVYLLSTGFSVKINTDRKEHEVRQPRRHKRTHHIINGESGADGGEQDIDSGQQDADT